jgi:S-adenosylmethionine decarboxylase
MQKPITRPSLPEPIPDGGVGYHTIFDFYHCVPDILNDLAKLDDMMLRASREAGAQVINIQSKQFEPHGVSSIVVLAESHLSLHTWPEHHFAAVDLFTCTPKIDVMIAKNILQETLGSQRLDVKTMRRGFPHR